MDRDRLYQAFLNSHFGQALSNQDRDQLPPVPPIPNPDAAATPAPAVPLPNLSPSPVVGVPNPGHLNSVPTPGHLVSVPTPGSVVTALQSFFTRSSLPCSTGTTQELSGLFAPYNSERPGPSRRFQATSRLSQIRSTMPYGSNKSSPGISKKVSTVGANWQKSIQFLGSPFENRAPTKHRKDELRDNNLRKVALLSHTNATESEILNTINELVVQLEKDVIHKRFENVRWTFMFAEGSGSRQQLSPILPAVTPRVMSALQVKLIYAVPDTVLVELEPDEIPECDEHEVETSTPTSASDSSQACGSPTTLQLAQTSPKGGFVFNISTEQEQLALLFEGIFTLDDFRSHMRFLNQGTEKIVVNRVGGKIPVEDVLSWYTETTDLFIRPRVRFANEEGIDAGGLMREYFGETQLACLYSKCGDANLFEGEADHMLPTCGVSLMIKNMYWKLGRFMLHSFFNLGYFFFGLSPIIPQVVFMDNTKDLFNTVVIDDLDLPCESSRNLLKMLRAGQQSQDDMTVGDKLELISGLATFNVAYDSNGVDEVIRQLKYAATIHRRKEQLLAIREGFLDSSIYSFVKLRANLFHSGWKSLNEYDSSVSVVLSMFINGEDFPREFLLLSKYLQSLADAGTPLRGFLSWLTGVPIVLEQTLRFGIIDSNRRVSANVCDNALLIPRGISEEGFRAQLDEALIQELEFGLR